MTETLVPLHWRNKRHFLNPNENGYRPAPPVTNEIPASATITCSTYRGDTDSIAEREVQPYSHSVIIYQDSGSGVAV